MREEGISSSADPLLFPNSPPHTAAASSAGASSPAVAINAGSTDWLGQGQAHGSKAGSLSRISSQPVWISLSTSACGSALGSSQPSCRPWERGDLLRRLSTFRPANWFGKPKAASSLACARRGWVNVDVDKIQCESCGASLKYNSLVSWIPTKGENNGDEFANQLDEGHTATCPWRGNSCAESLVQFPPTPPSALVGGYKDRCDGLLQFTYLPRVANSAVDQMKLSRSQEIDRFLVKSTAFLPDVVTSDLEICVYSRAQKLISLCGWEPRWLPNVQDCEENSAQSARNGASFSPIKDPCGPASKSESRSPLLDCSLCGSTVSIMDFIQVNRPPRFAPSNIDVPETSKKTVITRGVSAASGIGGWVAADGGIDEAATTGMDLNLTVGSGFSTAHGHKRPVSELYQDGNIGRDLDLGQPAGSEVGDRAASYESRGPKRKMDEGGSTVDRPHGSVRQTDSVEGDVIDREGDEVNDSQPGPSQTLYFEPYEQTTTTIARNSSVIAIDTIFNEDDDTDSMESVENHPGFINDVSIKSPNENDTSDLNLNLDHSIQAQESRVRVTGQLGGISSTNDEEVLNRTETGATTGRGLDPGGAVSGGSVGMGASHEGEIHGSGGLMIQRAGSVVGDMEPVTGLTGQTETETGQQECSGRGDSGSKVDGSVKGESGEKISDLNLLPNEQSSHPSVSCNAVVCSGIELSKDEVMQDVKSSPTANGLGPPNGESNFEEAMEFDPIKHHNFFCPWVNGNVAAAGVINSENGASSSGQSQSQTLCGWQLTLDALDGFQDPQQNQTVESESAASLYKDDHQGSGKKLMARHSFNKRRGQN